jgi:UDP-N-acetylmuramoyl-L-alanyl-D-glutamate--2,6-diaminopimelate ligase
VIARPAQRSTTAGTSVPGSGGIDWDAIRSLRIERLVSDSRELDRGDTFVAYPGETRDGRDFIPQAIQRGAASVLWERGGFEWRRSWRVQHVGVTDLRARAGEIASEVYGRPSARLWMVGVTGTNGKTSCSQWIAQSLTRSGRRCGIIGTLGSGWPGKLDPIANTTPDAVWLQRRLRDFVRQRARAVSMEVSSHGLAQNRVSGVHFDVALLTNLTRDHLDYHGTMKNYRAAKARLFAFPGLKWAVLNLDDAFGARLVRPTRKRGVQVLGYGFDRNLPSHLRGERVPRLIGRNLRMGAEGISFDVATPWGRAFIESTLIGRFNASNLLASLGVLLASGIDLEAAVANLRKVAPVAGRTERYGGGRRPLVVVDYAHTPDALENVLRALRELLEHPPQREGVPTRAEATGKLVCVFGCGGDRDRGKRPLMGRIATSMADEVFVTSDNPRSEDPLAIITDILEGISGQCAVVPDRTEAIRAAIRGARRGDIVLVAGKGHEQYQEIGGVRHRYSDAASVREALREGAA